MPAALQQQVNPSQCSAGAGLLASCHSSAHWPRQPLPGVWLARDWDCVGQRGQRPSLVFLYLLAYRFASVFSPVGQPSKLEHVRSNVVLETCDLTGIKAWELRKGNRYFSPALEHEVRHIKEPPFGTKVA